MYACIVADPPWNEQGGGKIKRGADRHYPLLKAHEILEVMVQSPLWKPAPDAHLYLWVTNNFLPQGLQVMKSLGFRYVTNVAWMKNRQGLGQYFRGQHELCLFGVRIGGRGTLYRTDNRSIPSVIQAPRGRHSAKPDLFYELVEARTEGPRLEMFARTAREGWDVWGNEV
jgi:N6-adenosine-specific RNA methylase IME4